jgi:hypothetical protein
MCRSPIIPVFVCTKTFRNRLRYLCLRRPRKGVRNLREIIFTPGEHVAGLKWRVSETRKRPLERPLENPPIDDEGPLAADTDHFGRTTGKDVATKELKQVVEGEVGGKERSRFDCMLAVSGRGEDTAGTRRGHVVVIDHGMNIVHEGVKEESTGQSALTK